METTPALCTIRISSPGSDNSGSGKPVPGTTEALAALAARAAEVRGSAAAALALAPDAAAAAPLPGVGRTRELWELLATLAAADLTAARAVEPHLDALAILDQAGVSPEAGTWAVYAAEGPGLQLNAARSGAGWELTGTKPWCSLAAHVDHAVVTAHVGDGLRRAFAVDLRQPGVTAATGTWTSLGLAEVDSGPVEFRRAHAVPVGEPNWYLQRPGFAWGGMGVAACWYGGAVGVARRLFRSLTEREPDQVAHLLLGQADIRLQAARQALDAAAAQVDLGQAQGEAGAILAARVRAIVAESAEAVLAAAGHAMGPAPLALEEEHGRRVADLQIYLRQHHAERDLAVLGRTLARDGGAPW